MEKLLKALMGSALGCFHVLTSLSLFHSLKWVFHYRSCQSACYMCFYILLVEFGEHGATIGKNIKHTNKSTVATNSMIWALAPENRLRATLFEASNALLKAKSTGFALARCNWISTSCFHPTLSWNLAHVECLCAHSCSMHIPYTCYVACVM